MINGDLNFEIDKLLGIQDEVEQTHSKIALIKTVLEATDTNPLHYALDFEDSSYFYDTEQERDSDYNELCILLNSRSRFYTY